MKDNQPAEAKRLSVALKTDASKMLDEITESSGMTISQAIHRAIATEFYIRQEIEDGSKILVQKSNEEIREVIFR